MAFSDMVSTFGEATAKAIYLEEALARQDVARFIQDENIDCGFKMTGRFTGAIENIMNAYQEKQNS